MKKKAKRRSNQQTKGRELSDAELEKASGGVGTKFEAPMQQENRALESTSNVLKTRHDTAKNAIGNVR